jgi:hypothetical protein
MFGTGDSDGFGEGVGWGRTEFVGAAGLGEQAVVIIRRIKRVMMVRMVIDSFMS